MAKDLKNLPVKEFSCFCRKMEGCAICNKQSIIVEQWLCEGEDERVDLFRFDGASDDYIEGFMAALLKDPRTSRVHKNKIL